MTAPEPDCLYVFDTTTHALWAEETVLARGIPAEVVPAPADAQAGCDLALRTTPDHRARLEEALTEEGVPYQRHVPRG